MKHDVKQKYYIEFYGNIYYTAQSFHFSSCHVLEGSLQYVERKSCVSINDMFRRHLFTYNKGYSSNNKGWLPAAKHSYCKISVFFKIFLSANLIICTGIWFSVFTEVALEN